MSQLCTVSDFFHQSPVHCVVLKGMIESLCPGAAHTVVNNVCRTIWIARLDAIAKNVDGKYCRSNVEKAKPLFMSTCQF